MSNGARLGVAVLAVAVVAAVAAGVGTAVANSTGDARGPIAGVPVKRVVLVGANGTPTAVVATATLPHPTEVTGKPRAVAAAGSGDTAATVAIARRDGGVAVGSIQSTTDRPPATAYRGSGRGRIGGLTVPAGATLTWTVTGSHGAGFTVRGAAAQGPILAIRSPAPRGSRRVAAGSYRNVVVSASGHWTLVLVPRN